MALILFIYHTYSYTSFSGHMQYNSNSYRNPSVRDIKFVTSDMTPRNCIDYMHDYMTTSSVNADTYNITYKNNN